MFFRLILSAWGWCCLFALHRRKRPQVSEPGWCYPPGETQSNIKKVTCRVLRPGFFQVRGRRGHLETLLSWESRPEALLWVPARRARAPTAPVLTRVPLSLRVEVFGGGRLPSDGPVRGLRKPWAGLEPVYPKVSGMATFQTEFKHGLC